MTEIIGVRFKDVGKIYYFSPNNKKVESGCYVIVETARGVECGEVVIANREVDDSKVVQPLKSIMRIATEKDLETQVKNREKEQEIMKVYRALAKYFPSWVGYNMAKCGGCIRACVSMLEKPGGCMHGRFKNPLRTRAKAWKMDR